MQRWFLILMLVLLPVRSWSAQLMGVQMGTMQMGAMQMTAVQAHATHEAVQPLSLDASMASHADMNGADMPADCPMHLASATPSFDTPATPDGNHPTCQACQLCMPLALLSSGPLHLGRQHSPLPLPLALTSFVSAELAQVAKPPIL